MASNISFLDLRDDLVLVDAFDALVNMSDGSQRVYQHQAYIAQVKEDGSLIPYTPTQDDLVLLFNKKYDIIIPS